jgi:hypothetical protein
MRAEPARMTLDWLTVVPSLPLAEASIAAAIFWSMVVLGLLIVGMMAAIRIRRKIKQEEEVTAGPVAGFTLSDLRQMHRAGQLTDAEFERAKEKVVLAAQKVAAHAAPSPGTPVARDSTDAIRARRLAREAQNGLPPDELAGS